MQPIPPAAEYMGNRMYKSSARGFTIYRSILVLPILLWPLEIPRNPGVFWDNHNSHHHIVGR